MARPSGVIPSSRVFICKTVEAGDTDGEAITMTSLVEDDHFQLNYREDLRNILPP